MNVENLNEKSLEMMKAFVGQVQEQFPEVTSKVYQMPNEPTNLGLSQQIEKLQEAINCLHSRIDFIFGNCVLINGKFVNPIDNAKSE